MSLALKLADGEQHLLGTSRSETINQDEQLAEIVLDFDLTDSDEPKVRRCRQHIWEAEKHLWKPYQLAEREKCFGYCSRELIKKTFLNTTQMVPSVQHENETFPKDPQGACYPFLSLLRLNEVVYFDPVEFPKQKPSSKPQYGLLFYASRSKIKDIYPLGNSKDLTAQRVVDCLYSFTQDYGAPRAFKSDHASNLEGALVVKHFCQSTFSKVLSTEAGKHQSNLVERAWQDL